MKLMAPATIVLKSRDKNITECFILLRVKVSVKNWLVLALICCDTFCNTAVDGSANNGGAVTCGGSITERMTSSLTLT